MNRLSKEKSPYLLQHASNPVNWLPWEAAAFTQAKAEDKPVFLSIGYSTCHWCHVMAHESFEDKDVAEALNKNYICIKVDREERPDIDTVYMSVCQALTGAGGWPLTILMTPGQKPFWAGTYLPKTTAYGRTGLLELLALVKKHWDCDRENIMAAGEQIVSLLNSAGTKEAIEPDKQLLHSAYEGLEHSFDQRWGGFGKAPKFPMPHNLLFLLQYGLLEKDPAPVRMAEHTLIQMFRGGIYDHLGGGFSRYSTDEKWLVPHFEKMLYDNGLLALAYSEAYHITQKPVYSKIAQGVLDYVLRSLTDKQGGFYCGEDADSDGVEGKYYVFTKREIHTVLGEAQGKLFCNWFGITEKGNFEGKSILNLLGNPRYEEDDDAIRLLSSQLYDYRSARTRLHKDDKVLTAWNSIMIAAFAKAGWLLEHPVYLEAAKKAQLFIKNAMCYDNGKLKLRWREGETAHHGQIDDYAFYAFALLQLYQSTLETDYLQQAVEISEEMLKQFWDKATGGLFLYSEQSEQLISRPKETYDGAIPSGNSVAAIVFESLAKLTGETKWQQVSSQQLGFLAKEIQRQPSGHSVALLAMSKVLYPTRELICVTPQKGLPLELKDLLTKNHLPNLTLMLKTNENKERLAKAAPFTENYPIPESGAVYYLCQNGVCTQPIDTLASLRAYLWIN